jgi:hypothetical protein
MLGRSDRQGNRCAWGEAEVNRIMSSFSVVATLRTHSAELLLIGMGYFCVPEHIHGEQQGNIACIWAIVYRFARSDQMSRAPLDRSRESLLSAAQRTLPRSFVNRGPRDFIGGQRPLAAPRPTRSERLRGTECSRRLISGEHRRPTLEYKSPSRALLRGYRIAGLEWDRVPSAQAP